MALAPDDPKYSTFLTWEEWRMVYAYAWTARIMRCYGLEEIDDDLFSEMVNNEGRSMLWATRKLALKHGMKFTAVAVDPDYRVRLLVPEDQPIEPRNETLVDKLRAGKGLQYHRLLEFAIEYALSHELKSFDFEPMREALARVNDDLGAQRKERTPEDEKLIDESMEYLLGQIGVRRADRKLPGDN